MAQIAITLVDAPDGKVDIQIYVDGVKDGEPDSEAQKLAKAMLKDASVASFMTDAEPKN